MKVPMLVVVLVPLFLMVEKPVVITVAVGERLSWITLVIFLFCWFRRRDGVSATRVCREVSIEELSKVCNSDCSAASLTQFDSTWDVYVSPSLNVQNGDFEVQEAAGSSEDAARSMQDQRLDVEIEKVKDNFVTEKDVLLE